MHALHYSMELEILPLVYVCVPVFGLLGFLWWLADITSEDGNK